MKFLNQPSPTGDLESRIHNALVTGPLMSFGASGSIADQIVFSKWKGRAYVRELVVPSNPRSPSQYGGRSMMAFLSQAWATIDPLDQATWQDLADAGTFSTFNAYVKENMRRWTQSEAPGVAYPITETGTQPALDPGNAVGGVGTITIDDEMTALNDGWGVVYYVSSPSGYTPSRLNARLVVELPGAPGPIVRIMSGFEPGGYFVNRTRFTRDGALATPDGEVNVTVT